MINTPRLHSSSGNFVFTKSTVSLGLHAFKTLNIVQLDRKSQQTEASYTNDSHRMFQLISNRESERNLVFLLLEKNAGVYWRVYRGSSRDVPGNTLLGFFFTCFVIDDLAAIVTNSRVDVSQSTFVFNIAFDSNGIRVLFAVRCIILLLTLICLASVNPRVGIGNSRAALAIRWADIVTKCIESGTFYVRVGRAVFTRRRIDFGVRIRISKVPYTTIADDIGPRRRVRIL
jgi:hypothetical protein